MTPHDSFLPAIVSGYGREQRARREKVRRMCFFGKFMKMNTYTETEEAGVLVRQSSLPSRVDCRRRFLIALFQGNLPQTRDLLSNDFPEKEQQQQLEGTEVIMSAGRPS